MVEQTAVIDYKGTRSRKKIEEAEAELKRLQETDGEEDATEEQATTEETDEGPEPTTAEEKVWKKRHGDLRRHTQKKIDELTKQIETLTARVEQEKTNPSISEEKLNEVAERNPVVTALIEKRAREIADEMLKTTNEKFESLTKREEEILEEKGQNAIRKDHPDYDSIVSSDEFHKWAEDQDWLHNIIYVDDYYKKPDAVSQVLNLYKVSNGMTPAATKQKKKDALAAVDSKGASEPVTNTNQGKIKESFFASAEFARLNPKKQEEMMEKWNEAVRSGNAIYDLSRK